MRCKALDEEWEAQLKQDEAIAILVAHRSALDRFGVKSLRLFGSVSRNEATSESDVDLLVEFSQPVGLFRFSEVRLFLEKILDRPVDLGTRNSLKPKLQETVLKESIHVF